MSSQNPWRVRRKKVPRLSKRDATPWGGKQSITERQPTRISGFTPEEIDRRINAAIAKGMTP